ncbi:hypothetical protein FRC06_010179 [Ceratobasidium sp. 370]|nr:hypothetical protein FRC06_010179 [Ceratobasidium sp. 370]
MSAIDVYLASPLVTKDNKATDGGLMAYWTREQSQGSPIVDMALDILMVPASSVDAERHSRAIEWLSITSSIEWA